MDTAVRDRLSTNPRLCAHVHIPIERLVRHRARKLALRNLAGLAIRKCPKHADRRHGLRRRDANRTPQRGNYLESRRYLRDSVRLQMSGSHRSTHEQFARLEALNIAVRLQESSFIPISYRGGLRKRSRSFRLARLCAAEATSATRPPVGSGWR